MLHSQIECVLAGIVLKLNYMDIIIDTCHRSRTSRIDIDGISLKNNNCYTATDYQTHIETRKNLYFMQF